MNLLSVLLNIAFRSMAGFIPSGGAKSEVILLFVMAVVTLGWIFTLIFLLSSVLANSFLGFSMRDNLRHAVAATPLIIWRRSTRTRFDSIVTVLVTCPNNVLPMSNVVYVRRRHTKPLIVNCRGLGAYLQIALQTLSLLPSLLPRLLRIILVMMIMKLSPLITIFFPLWMSNVKEDGDVPASISDVPDDNDADDDDDDDDGDDDDDDI